MKENEFTGQESDDQLVEDIEQIKTAALGEGAVVCQACGSELREGAPVVVYAFRPIDKPTFEVGNTKCAEGRYVPSECFTLGVRELLVEGRVGTCSDQAIQSSWPVLVAPEPVAVSAASTKSVQWLSEETRERVRERDESKRACEPDPDRDRDEPASLIDRVLRVRVAERCAELRACESPCGRGGDA
jgi:hypothetical protein